MKKNENKKIINENQSNFSPVFQKKKYFFGKSFIKDLEKNTDDIALSSNKSENELILPKKKILYNTSHHKRTKSNSKKFIRIIQNKNINLNKSALEISFNYKNNELDIQNNINNYSSITRNKNKNNFNEQKLINLLSINISLKEFRNKIINSFSQSIKYDDKNNKNIVNFNNKKNDYNLDKSYNKEETTDNTSISGLNNTYLIVNRQISDSQEKNKNPMKYIKINKSNKKLFSLKSNSSKNINQSYYNTNIKKKQYKFNLPQKIKNNNIKTKINTKLTNINNLILKKKTFPSGHKSSTKEGKIQISPFNPISKLNDYNFNYLESDRKGIKTNKNICLLDTNTNKMEKKNGNKDKYKKRKSKNKEINSNKYNNGCGLNFIESSKEFKSVEEIHFLYVYINQKKKEYFEKNNNVL